MHTLLTRIHHVFIDAGRDFIEDDCYSKASSLTFYSLLSIVPVLAVLLGIAKGFGFETALKLDITERFQEQRQAAEIVLQLAATWLQNVRSSVITGLGALLLFWSVIGLFNNIEKALNAIWKTKFSRSYSRKLIDYLAMMVISPFFIVTLSGLNVYLTVKLTSAWQDNAVVETVGPALLSLLKLFPYFLSWCFFTFIYVFMPNTRVYFPTALLSGFLAGTAFQIWQWIYIKFQIGVASYGAIYGSFAALPLFLVWLQVSWLILLAGAELAYEMENTLFVPKRTQHKLPAKTAAMYIAYKCVEAFSQGLPPITDLTLSRNLGLSLQRVHHLVEALQRSGILALVSYEDRLLGYQPARDPGSITVKAVCDAIDRSEEMPAFFNDSVEMQAIETHWKKIDTALSEPSINQPLYSGPIAAER